MSTDDERLREAVRQKNAFTGLLRTEGWEMLTTILQEQVEMRRNSFELTPLESMDQIPAQEFKKGEIAGLRMAAQLPQDILDDAQSIIDTTRETEGAIDDG